MEIKLKVNIFTHHYKPNDLMTKIYLTSDSCENQFCLKNLMWLSDDLLLPCIKIVEEFNINPIFIYKIYFDSLMQKMKKRKYIYIYIQGAK